MRIAYFIIACGIGMVFLFPKYATITLGEAVGLLWIAIGWLGVIIVDELRKCK